MLQHCEYYNFCDYSSTITDVINPLQKDHVRASIKQSHNGSSNTLNPDLHIRLGFLKSKNFCRSYRSSSSCPCTVMFRKLRRSRHSWMPTHVDRCIRQVRSLKCRSFQGLPALNRCLGDRSILPAKNFIAVTSGPFLSKLALQMEIRIFKGKISSRCQFKKVCNIQASLPWLLYWHVL